MRLVRNMLETWILFLKVQMVDEKNIDKYVHTYDYERFGPRPTVGGDSECIRI